MAMQGYTFWSDRGGALEIQPRAGEEESPALLLLSRGGSVVVSAPAATVWLVLRGSAEVECREGRFPLARGGWLSLERDARPTVYAGGDAVLVGVAMTADMQAQLHQSAQVVLFPGMGTATRGARLDALRLWRRCARFARNDIRAVDMDRHRIGQVLRLLAAQQADYRSMVDRCPGRSLRRKRQVFCRMQRAWLHLEGHMERPVRITELAGLSNVSVWYFTKTFHALYGEGPQAASARLRLARAAQLLRRTRLSVSEVGAACGFENNCSFSRAFRAQHGMPPSLYRLADGGRTSGANASDIGRQANAGWAP
ncbi:helix-turn-helix transcriptional regulator [Luteimonas sp. M1R5S18]|uniref:Helix-turn-helix transcriptional regulator n=1 Tax=Luteimonas rhizosphaericola TaxID=3042024 RepID=A0ABT6JKQ1_9GAMM|nr:helix-turn-helix transcriptional regulator [Luteimonas rhizosphaericola]MDH5831245.1 helix-turn-helix transcriptional regulator [Luteimonas rhizosphaericola]